MFSGSKELLNFLTLLGTGPEGKVLMNLKCISTSGNGQTDLAVDFRW